MNMARHALVFGGTGFLGRHLVLALDQAGICVTVATRSRESFAQMSLWLADHGCRVTPNDLRVDFDAHQLGQGEGRALDDVTEIYNCAGAYQFGMTMAEARHANVDSIRAIVSFAAGLPRLRRLVHVSGYRVGGQDPADVPWRMDRVQRTYRRLGVYEASKVEGDATLQALADRLGVVWSIVNPSSVIGASDSGESDQQLGLAASVKELWHGTLAARPGNARTFVPVVPVDYLARFMTLQAVEPDAARQSFWVLDDDTPALPDLLSLVGEHYGVRVPRTRVPIPLVKHLPRQITKADPETLTFLSSDRYPTGPAHEFARNRGLQLPDTTQSILRWADYLAAHRFGEAPNEGAARWFHEYAGVHTFGIGSEHAPTLVLPGLPVNADTWATVVTALGCARVMDLPGLGMSSGSPRDWAAWLTAQIDTFSSVHLVGHSIGAAAVMEVAAADPDRIGSITLVAPFFLQPAAGFSARLPLLSRWYLRRARADVLSRRLTGTADHRRALESSVLDLHRGRAAANVAELLAAASGEKWRRKLRSTLASYPGPIHVIVGSKDPLTDQAHALLDSLGARVRLTTITGAGHHPQLTHAGELARAIAQHAVATPPQRNRF